MSGLASALAFRDEIGDESEFVIGRAFDASSSVAAATLGTGGCVGWLGGELAGCRAPGSEGTVPDGIRVFSGP